MKRVRRKTLLQRRYLTIVRDACALVLKATNGDALRALGLLYTLQGPHRTKERQSSEPVESKYGEQ